MNYKQNKTKCIYKLLNYSSIYVLHKSILEIILVNYKAHFAIFKCAKRRRKPSHIITGHQVGYFHNHEEDFNKAVA